MSGDAFRLSCGMALSHEAYVKLVGLNNDRPKIRWSSEKKADGLITVILVGTALTEDETSVFMTEMAGFVGAMSQLKIEKIGESPDQAILPAAPLSQGDAEKRATLYALLDTRIGDIEWVVEGATSKLQSLIINNLSGYIRYGGDDDGNTYNNLRFSPTIGRLVLLSEMGVRRISGVGPGKQLQAIKAKLAELGLRLGMSPAELDGWVPLEERDGALA